MTDDTIRPESDPSRETEPQRPEGAVDEASEEVASSEQTGETEVVGEAVVTAPEGSTGEMVDEEETFDSVAQPAVEEVASAGTVDAEEASASGTDGDTGEQASDVTDASGGPKATSAAPTDASEPAAAVVTGPADDTAVSSARDDVFAWHPDYKGKSFDEVRAALAQDIAADQRQHRLAMEGAEESEQEALASVVGLERKWGPYDFDWAEAEPDDLADRIVAFERERERREELISWRDYRNPDADADEAVIAGERPAELSTSAKGLSLLLVVLLIVVILLAVWAL